MEYLEYVKLKKLRRWYEFSIKKEIFTKEKKEKYIKEIENKIKELKTLENKITQEEEEKYKKIYNAKCNKIYRIRQKIKSWDINNLYFITLTINEENINKSLITFKDKIKEICKNKDNWIFNEDYGKKNKRLHFHGIVEGNINLEPWKYGYTNIKKVTYGKDITAISKYLEKITNHTIKKGARSIIYGRQKRKRKESK